MSVERREEFEDSRLTERVSLLRGGLLFSECTDDELEEREGRVPFGA